MTIMISQPMFGKTDEEIYAERQGVVRQLQSEGHEVADTVFQDEPPTDVKNRGLWYLAKSIEAMSKVDGMYFMEGWDERRGCICEHFCAEHYDIPIL